MKLLTYPYLARKGSKLWQICQDLDIGITQDINSDFDRAIYWNIKTVSTPDKRISGIPDVINIRCTDVSKNKVDAAWGMVSGYSISVSPETYSHKYIRKSKLQYTHDGRIFTEPQKRQPGYVYQKCIQTKVDDRYVTIRVPVFRNKIPCIFLKKSFFRFIEGRMRIDIIWPGHFKDHISRKELIWLDKFNEIMGVDFAEIDMIRDVNTGKIYAIDVNNIAGDGIYGKLSQEDTLKIKEVFASYFRRFVWKV